MKTKVCKYMLLGVLVWAGAAQAQMTVFDPVNYTQNLLIAARTLAQVNQQVRQLQNEAQMLLNQARNLQQLDLNTLNRLREVLARTERLLDEAQGLTFDVETAREVFARLHPEDYAAEILREQIEADAQARWTSAREALRTAVDLQSQVVASVADDETVLADLVGASQSAVGALQAAQSTNQLLALQARQLIQTQQLQAAQGRAAALEQARTVAAEAQSRELRRRFMTGKAAYTGEPAQLFNP